MNKKMYVIVRNDITSAQKAVQAGHALAAWMLQYSGWQNNTLVYLQASSKLHLQTIVFQLMEKYIVHTRFFEPDMNNELTAIASLGSNSIFKKLPLLE